MFVCLSVALKLSKNKLGDHEIYLNSLCIMPDKSRWIFGEKKQIFFL